jgi:hypothetical protein
MTLKAVPFARDGSVLEPPTSSKAWRAAKVVCALREVGMASRVTPSREIWGQTGSQSTASSAASAVSVGAASIHPRAMFNEPIADLRVGRPLQ